MIMPKLNNRLVVAFFVGLTFLQPTNGSAKAAFHVPLRIDNTPTSGMFDGRRKMTLFDFTRMDNVDDWQEISDTVRTIGKSKATLVLQKTQIFQKAIFFTLLNPQPNGAGFAGVRTQTDLNLKDFQNIDITCRGQGKNNHYKVVLRHNGLNSNKDWTYEQFFDVPMSNEEFSTISLKLDSFKPYYRGREIPDGEPLNVENITMFGLQVFGGVYLPFKQSSVSALEIEIIAAS